MFEGDQQDTVAGQVAVMADNAGSGSFSAAVSGSIHFGSPFKETG